MNPLTDKPDAFTPGGSTIAPRIDRLWPALSRSVKREQPAAGLDLLGERVKAAASRKNAGRELRQRAERIIDSARALRDIGERALEERITAARELAATRFDDPATIDSAYAVMYEVVRRELTISLYPEQVMGALGLAARTIVEMATGEGKTLTGILPAALHAWRGRGVHVVTVNDYLARRDAEITSPAYARLGLSVGVLQDSTLHPERIRAYACSITYAADKEVIFDFLRDRLHAPINPRLSSLLIEQLGESHTGEMNWPEKVVQRGLEAAIVDEADSVLIDEAITPAIIGADRSADPANARLYSTAAAIARGMIEGEHYKLDRRMRLVALTDAGRARLGDAARDLPAFWSGPRRREELVVQALIAQRIYARDDDYVVRDGEIQIVDPSTGRVLDGRKWQHGLHQAVEAKEGVEVSVDRGTTARISYQRFFQRYRHLSGMTGTAWEVSDELWEYYRLPVLRVPTHKPCIRRVARDRVFQARDRKFDAVARRAAELHAQRRPVLIGTRSVEASEALGRLLGERGVECKVLNANREAEEAEVVARAGRAGAVTVATNMAGRGTDILLDDESREGGGLVVIATERHFEARVDRQLIGRCARQGDPGLAEFFLAFDDAIIAHQSVRLLRLLARFAPPLRGLLWWTAQRASSRRAVVQRRNAAQYDAWIDLALHQHTR